MCTIWSAGPGCVFVVSVGDKERQKPEDIRRHVALNQRRKCVEEEWEHFLDELLGLQSVEKSLYNACKKRQCATTSSRCVVLTHSEQSP